MTQEVAPKSSSGCCGTYAFRLMTGAGVLETVGTPEGAVAPFDVLGRVVVSIETLVFELGVMRRGLSLSCSDRIRDYSWASIS